MSGLSAPFRKQRRRAKGLHRKRCHSHNRCILHPAWHGHGHRRCHGRLHWYECQLCWHGKLGRLSAAFVRLVLLQWGVHLAVSLAAEAALGHGQHDGSILRIVKQPRQSACCLRFFEPPRPSPGTWRRAWNFWPTLMTCLKPVLLHTLRSSCSWLRSSTMTSSRISAPMRFGMANPSPASAEDLSSVVQNNYLRFGCVKLCLTKPLLHK